jgi:formylglycine-generating enzyme required for sulfatase activity/pimeloyl-ACP methyl ester carboxylesterase
MQQISETVLQSAKFRSSILYKSSFIACLIILLSYPIVAQTQVPIGQTTTPSGQTTTDRFEPIDTEKDILKLKEDLQQLRNQFAELRKRNDAVVDHLTFAPVLDAQLIDYAKARSSFRTKLIRNSPSPQESSAITLPQGIKEIKYKSGGLQLKAWINLPPDEKQKRPAILYLHGGFAFGIGDWEQTKPYRDAGFIVLAPMLRGENGQPGAFSYFYNEVDDVLAAGEYLSKLPQVDAKRIFIAGHSIGGTMTMLATQASHLFRAAAVFDGASYWGPFTEATDLPFDKTDPREIILRSPMAFAGSFKSPVRLYYQNREQTSLTEFFALMNRRTVVLAKNRGLDVEGVEIEGNHMSIVHPAIQQSIAFFQRISGMDIVPFKGNVSPLPQKLEFDLGGKVMMRLERIEKGKFRMGSPNDEAGRGADESQHTVEIADEFLMVTFAVTQAQYAQVMGTRPSLFSLKGLSSETVLGMNTDSFPVENISWEDATDFCRIVSLIPTIRDKGWIVDLPTEVEWEYAARAGTETVFYTGATLSPRQANFNGGNRYSDTAKTAFLNRTTAVGSYEPNHWGLYDMFGNVPQWVKDIYSSNYERNSSSVNADRVVRGCFFFDAVQDCRSARRLHFPQSIRNSATRGAPPIGFRIVIRQIRDKND